MRFRKRTLNHFGLERLGRYTDDVIDMFVSDVADAIENRELIAVSGRYGMGKSHVLQRVKKRLGDGAGSPRWVHVHDMSESQLSFTSIMNGVIVGIDEQATIPNMKELRHRTAKRMLGRQFEYDRPACIIIDDAHRMTEDALSACKMLMEAEGFLDEDPPICSVVLVGWSKLDGKLQRRQDIALRTRRVQLREQNGYMTPRRRRAFLEAVFGNVIEETTRKRIASTQQTPLHMKATVRDAMRMAMEAGYDRVDQRTIKPSLGERYEAVKDRVSQKDIARKATQIASEQDGGPSNVSTSTVNKRITREQDDEYDNLAHQALDELEANADPSEKAEAHAAA